MTLQRVMLIDDDEISNFIYRRLIKLVSDKIEIHECTSGESALRKIAVAEEADLPQIIFLDVHLAGMNAWEFLSKFEELGKSKNLDSVKIYVASSSLDERDIYKAYQSDFVAGFLGKPIAFDKLKSICTMPEYMS